MESAPPCRLTLSPRGWRVLTAALLVACAAPPPPPPSPTTPEPPAPAAPLPPPVLPSAPAAAAQPPPPSQAPHARAYRQDAARHLYKRNTARIWRGKLPALLYAVGVLQVDINRQGAVTGLRWMRAPRHAPEVVAEIERTVRAAAPFPIAKRLGSVTYTDTWLWDRSGQFQLDTLTEGQH